MISALYRIQSLVRILVVSIITISGLQFSNLDPHHITVGSMAAVSSSGIFDKTFLWVIAGGYVLMFIGMMTEGPMVTAAGAFAAALGYFNIWIVFALAILGDFLIDCVLFWIGHFSRTAFVERYGHKVGLTTTRIRHIEHLLKTHPRKTIIAVKLTPFVPIPGIMLIGSSHMSFQKFASTCLMFIVPSAILFVSLGYFFGRAYDGISHYVQNAEYFIIIAVASTLLIYYGYKRFTVAFSRQLQPI